MIQLGFDV